VDAIKLKVQRELEKFPRSPGGAEAPENIQITVRLNRLVAQAEEEARRMKDEFVSVEHLLVALFDEGGAAARILKEFGVTRDKLLKALQEVRGNQRVTSQNPEATYEALERYGRDLTSSPPTASSTR